MQYNRLPSSDTRPIRIETGRGMVIEPRIPVFCRASFPKMGHKYLLVQLIIKLIILKLRHRRKPTIRTMKVRGASRLHDTTTLTNVTVQFSSNSSVNTFGVTACSSFLRSFTAFLIPSSGPTLAPSTSTPPKWGRLFCTSSGHSHVTTGIT